MAENEAQSVVLRPPISDWVEAFNTGNVTAIVALYTQDAELFDSGMRRSRRGHDEIESWFRLRFSTMPTNVYSPQEQVLVEEEQTTVTWTLHGRGPRLLGQAWLSRPFQVDGVSKFMLRDGRICKQQGSYDHLSVLRQLVPPLRWFPRVVMRFIYYVYLWRHGQYY